MHPAVIAVLVVDLLGAVALALAMLQATRVAIGWDASSATGPQLRLERKAEEGAAAGRLGAVLHAIAALGLLLLVNHVLPPLVPGAMCGVGVMQALPDGWTAAAMRLVALVALSAWYAADRLNRGVPTGPLTSQSARMMLVAGAAGMIATWRSLSSLIALDLHKAVSCCAAVYDLGGRGAGGASMRVAGWGHAGLLIGMGAGIAVAALTARRPRAAWTHVPGAVMAAGFAALGAWVVVDFTGPVIYGTLGHRCPLCLFLPAHGGFGYLVSGALAWVLYEAASSLTMMLVSRGAPEALELAVSRARGGWARAAVASMVFITAAVGPQIAWWLRFGVMIGG